MTPKGEHGQNPGVLEVEKNSISANQMSVAVAPAGVEGAVIRVWAGGE